MNSRDVPSDIGYKNQSLTLQALRRGERAETRNMMVPRGDEEVPTGNMVDIPSNLDYKDQGLTVEEIYQRNHCNHLDNQPSSTLGIPLPQSVNHTSFNLNQGPPVVHAALMPNSPKDEDSSFFHVRKRNIWICLIISAIIAVIAVTAGVALSVSSSSTPIESPLTTTIAPSSTTTPAVGSLTTARARPPEASPPREKSFGLVPTTRAARAHTKRRT